MAKIIRKTASIFGGGLSAPSHQVEQFASKQQTGTPNYTVDPAVIMAGGGGAWWAAGWAFALNPTNNSEYKQDRNAVDLVATYQVAYILQQGIPEWDAATTYYTNSVVQFNGAIYQSLVDNNLNQTPPVGGSNTKWAIQILTNNNQPTRTVLTSGAGTYTPPVGCIRITVRMVGGGGGGWSSGGAGGNGGNTTLGTFSAHGGSGATGAGPGAGGAATGGSLNISGGYGEIATKGGADSFFGGAGTPAQPAVTNSGSGGGGNFGGGAGAYLEGQVAFPGALSYAVGAAGAGSGGTAGGSGLIIIEEFYF